MFENVDGQNADSQSNSFNEDSHLANKLVENIIPWRIWLKISTSFNDPWNQLRYIKWMNKRAVSRSAYVPTEIYHERYKCLETLLYIVMGLGPSIVIITIGHAFIGMSELKIGGLMYLLGICFFKADGSITCANAIWHLFVVFAASFHYCAILNYLFPSDISL